eukprot:2922553-Lingulodinium_polyedra.AAC.1
MIRHLLPKHGREGVAFKTLSRGSEVTSPGVAARGRAVRSLGLSHARGCTLACQGAAAKCPR